MLSDVDKLDELNDKSNNLFKYMYFQLKICYLLDLKI